MVVKYWNWFPREVVEVFKTQLDISLSNLNLL